MKKWLKGMLIACVVLLIAAFIGVAIFILTFDTTVYKNKLASMVKSEYNRELQVNGDIKLSLFPRIGLNASDVSLSERGSDEQFIHVDNMRLAVAIWPLISNRFLVDHMAITGLKATITRDHEGLLNFDDLLSLSHQEQTSSTTDLSTANQAETLPEVISLDNPQAVNDSLLEWLAKTDFKVDVAGMVLQKAQINYEDLALGHKVQLDNVQIDTGRITVGQAFDFHMQADVNGEKPQAAATLDVSGLLLLNPEKQQYSAQKLRASLLGRIQQLDLSKANLSGDFNLDTLSYAIFGKSVELSVQGKGLEESSTDNLRLDMTAPHLSYNASDLSLGLQNFALNSRIQRKDAQAIDIELRSPELNVSPTQAGGKPLNGKIAIQRTEQKIDLGFSLSNISGVAQDLNVEQVQLTGLYQPDENNKLEISLQSAGKFNLFEQTVTLPYIQGEVNLQDVAQEKLTFPMTGMLKTNILQDRSDFQLSFLNSQGKLAISGIFTNIFKPRISFDVSADKFRLDDFFADLALIDSTVDKTDSSKTENDKRLADTKNSDKPAATQEQITKATEPREGLENINLNFKQELLARLSGVGTFNFKELNYHDVVLNNVGATLIFDRQDVQIKSLKADVFGGQLSANGEYAVTTSALRTDARFTQVQAESLLKQLKGQALLTGLVDLHLEMRSYGLVEADLLKHLHGQVEIQADNGIFHGINVAELLRDPLMYYGLQDGSLGALNVDLTKQTPFEKISLKADVAQQQINFSQLDVLADIGKLTMQSPPSYYNWQDDKAEVPLLFQSLQPLKVQQGGIVFQVKRVTLPLLIQGPRQNLRIELGTIKQE